jgi:hemerythrin-like domain-containing protein
MGATRDRPDVTDMANLHKVFRDAVATGPQLVGGVADGDVDRAAFVASYYANVLALLRAHHVGEDELLTPLLVERCSPDDAAIARRIAEQHVASHHPADEADTAIAAWGLAADAGTSADALAKLEVLAEALLPHLDEEESLLLPLVSEQISLDEWAELPRHGMQTFDGDNIWLILGLIREHMTVAQLAAMEGAMPPPVLEAWRAVGEAEFQTFVGELRL